MVDRHNTRRPLLRTTTCSRPPRRPCLHLASPLSGRDYRVVVMWVHPCRKPWDGGLGESTVVGEEQPYRRDLSVYLREILAASSRDAATRALSSRVTAVPCRALWRREPGSVTIVRFGTRSPLAGRARSDGGSRVHSSAPHCPRRQVVPPTRAFLINYDDLLTRPHTVISSLLAWLPRLQVPLSLCSSSPLCCARASLVT